MITEDTTGSAGTSELSGVAGWMLSAIDAFGSVGVGLVTLVETVFPPIPSEAVLPAAGYPAGIGELSFWAAVFWATCGSVAGALVLYLAGASIGETRLANAATRLPLMSRDDIDRAWATFDRWQQPAIFWGRLVPGIRSLVSIPAGAQRMPLARFLALTASGSLLWNISLIGSGWWLGDQYGATSTVNHWMNVGLWAILIGLVAWFVQRKVRRRRSKPSPLQQNEETS